ncbi:hypothetical protein ACVII1_000876 [Bradyrhizobium elkanii]|uniref:Uncharacterized protein n=1 Tax=Bradyrhizobium elkanii TaxID=29448 RepID=A0A8I1YEC3_BRAEL|nr:hypothetical protein [Bradyrhizobium elkanii]MBP1298187.1 hypothetical protein [Bradyrhizobium elkanii]WLA36795.1 hypothetical protein QNJ95_27720 [Bradyrhizobium elkanii]
MGAIGTRSSLRPLIEEGETKQQGSDDFRRENALSYLTLFETVEPNCALFIRRGQGVSPLFERSPRDHCSFFSRSWKMSWPQNAAACVHR